MATVDERVAILEGSMKEQGAHIVGLRTDIADLRADVRGLRDEMGRRFEFADQQGARRFDDISREFAEQRAKFDRQFAWLVGIFFIGVLSIVTSFLGFR